MAFAVLLNSEKPLKSDVGLSHAGELPYNFGGYRQRSHQKWEHEVGDFINLKLK